MTTFKEMFQHIKTLDIIAVLIICVGFLFLAYAPADEVTRGRVSDLMFLTATYFFGASRSSAKKDETIKELASNNK